MITGPNVATRNPAPETLRPRRPLPPLPDYEDILAEYQDMSYSELQTALDEQRNYVESLSFDPTDVRYFDLVKMRLKLTDDEVAIFKRRGFVSIDHARRYSFGSAYYRIWTADVPVLITTDSILHALHKSYDGILCELETSFFAWTLEEILRDCHEALVAVANVNEEEALVENFRDVDLYLTVARNLLAGAVDSQDAAKAPHAEATPNGKLLVPTKFDQDAQVLYRLSDIRSLVLQEPNTSGPTEIYGGSRFVDYSQFRPRGHYAKTAQLRRYFRCVMWLGRADCGWNVLSTDHIRGIEADSDRELRNAILLTQSVQSTGGLKRLQAISDIIDFLVGRGDNLDVFTMAVLMQDHQVASVFDATEGPVFARLKSAIERGQCARQMIRSQVVISDTGDQYKVPPPSTFQLFGQRFILDSYVLSHVVFDSIIYQGRKQMRLLPSGLDAIAALGNSEAVGLLAPELTRWNYSANLMAAREFVHQCPGEFWNENLYHIWLDCLRLLDDDVCDEANFPEAMKTKAWQRKQLQTQLASWSELRHDNVLYAKQSYTAGFLCQYPAAYVEPYPDFYARIRYFAEEAARLLEAADYHCNDRQRDGKLKQLQEKHTSFFQNMARILAKLEGVARKELDARPTTPEEQDFLARAIDKRGSIRVGSGGVPCYDGWYGELLYGDAAKSCQWDPTIVDVHTDPTTKRTLEVGVGDVNFCVMAIDNQEDRMVYVGPVYSYFEFLHPAEDRLTDQRWQQMIAHGSVPERPLWTSVFQAPAHERPEEPMTVTVERDGDRLRLHTVKRNGGIWISSCREIRIEDARLKGLEGLTGLLALDLSDSGISDAGLAHLEGLIDLRTLGLSQTKISSRGLVYLKDLVNLQALALDDTAVTDSGLIQLQGLVHLEELSLRNTRVTKEGIEQLRRALPHTRIIR